jgi:O-antigen/teichoic acid export membrane protein
MSADGHSSHAETVVSNVKIVAISSVLVTIFAAATRILLPRFLGTAEIGRLTFAESWANLFLCFGQLGIGTWFMKHVSVRAAASTESAPSALFVSAIAMGLLWLAMVGALVLQGRDAGTITIVSVFGVYVALYLTQRGALTRLCVALGYTKFISTTDVLQRVVMIVTIVTALLVWPSAMGASLAMLAAQIVTFFAVMIYLARKGHLNWNFSSRHGLEIARQSMSFFIATVVVDVSANLDISILEHFSNPDEVGLLGSARRIQGALLMFVPAMYTSAQPTLARLQATDQKAYIAFFSELMRAVLAFSIFVGFGMAMFGDVAVRILYGENFSAASRSVILLGPATILTYLATFMGSTVILSSRGYVMAIQTLIVILLNLGLSIWLIPKGVSAGVGHGAAMTASVSAMTEFVVVAGLWAILGLKMIRPALMAHVVIWFVICFGVASNESMMAGVQVWERIPLFIFVYVFYAWLTGLIKWKDIEAVRQILGKKKS